MLLPRILCVFRDEVHWCNDGVVDDTAAVCLPDDDGGGGDGIRHRGANPDSVAAGFSFGRARQLG
jgi:hypothetical protein